MTVERLTPRASIIEAIEGKREITKCGVCGALGARPYPAGPRCDADRPRWPSLGPMPESTVVILDDPIDGAPGPVIFAGAEPADLSVVPDQALVRLAAKAGWSVVATTALAGVHTVKAVRPENVPDGVTALAQVGGRLTVDVVTPEVVASVALRMCRGHERAVVVWYQGRYACGVVWSDVEPLRSLLVTALKAWLARPAAEPGTVAP